MVAFDVIKVVPAVWKVCRVYNVAFAGSYENINALAQVWILHKIGGGVKKTRLVPEASDRCFCVRVQYGAEQGVQLDVNGLVIGIRQEQRQIVRSIFVHIDALVEIIRE